MKLSLAGYGATQAVPGPLFTFAAFLGASMSTTSSGWIGGLICLLAIFAPSFLLVVGALPFGSSCAAQHAHASGAGRGQCRCGGHLAGCASAGMDEGAIFKPQDFGLAVVALVADVLEASTLAGRRR